MKIETVHHYPEEYRTTTRQAREELDSGFKPTITTKISKLASDVTGWLQDIGMVS